MNNLLSRDSSLACRTWNGPLYLGERFCNRMTDLGPIISAVVTVSILKTKLSNDNSGKYDKQMPKVTTRASFLQTTDTVIPSTNLSLGSSILVGALAGMTSLVFWSCMEKAIQAIPRC